MKLNVVWTQICACVMYVYINLNYLNNFSCIDVSNVI